MGYTSAQAKEFISKIAPLMRSEATKRGYAICSTAIAQAIIEGAAGTSSLAKKYHNHFGMKCGKGYKGKGVNLKTKEEYIVGQLTTITDAFRVFENDEEGISGKGGYYDFISAKRYANLKTAKDYKQYAEMLKADGYATSSTYVNTLVNTVKKYDLSKYDNATTVIPSEPTKKSNEEIAKEVIAGKWGTGIVRRQKLTQAGYDYIAVQKIVNSMLKSK